MRTVLSAALLALALGVPDAGWSIGSEAEPIEVAPPAPWSGRDILDDPEWQKRFLGSYGVLSGLEPALNEVERPVLREVLQLMGDNPRAAIARLRPVVGGDSSASLDFILANLLFQTGQEEEAKRRYETAIDKFPDFRRAHKNLALLQVQENACEKAVEHLSRAVALGDRDGRNYGLLGYCHLSLEDHLAAEAAYRSAVLQEPEVVDWKLGLAQSLVALRKYPEAVDVLEKLIERDPENEKLWMLQANAYLGSERTEAAAANIEAVRLMGKAESNALVLLGDIYMNAGAPELAKDAYLEVIRGDQEAARFETAYRAAELLVRTDAFDEAREILDSIDSRYADELTGDQELEVLTLKAQVERSEGRTAEAARLYETIVERDGTRGEALLALARLRKQQGETERAALLLERAQRLEDVAYQAHLEHAQIMVARRDYRKAAELLKGALNIRSEPRVERYLARVQDAIPPR